MQKSNKPSVLVIEASAKAALPLIESLAKADLHVIAAGASKINATFFSRYCHERYIYPSCRDCPEAFKSWLLSFLSTRNIEMLFPVGHYGTLAVSEIQEEVRRYTRLLLPAHDTFLRGYAKIPTLKTAMEAGVPIPETWFPHEMEDGVRAAAQHIKNWPVLVKPSIAAGANGIIWCKSPEEIYTAWDTVTAKHGQCFLQDFVPAGGMQYKVDMLVDDKQSLLAGVVYGKTRMYPPDGGSSVLNFTAHRRDIIEYAHKMLVALKWVGFCDFDFIEDPRDNVPRLMEINPRFPECFRMCSAVGIDFPKMMYALTHGVSVPVSMEYPANRFLRFLPGDIMWFLRVNNRQRFTTWPSWFRFFDSATTYQICSLRDPGPIIGYLIQNTIELLGDRRTRRERLRLHSGKKNDPSRSNH